VGEGVTFHELLASTGSGAQRRRGPAGMAPLLSQLMADHAATGLPPAYLSKDEGVDLQPDAWIPNEPEPEPEPMEDPS